MQRVDRRTITTLLLLVVFTLSAGVGLAQDDGSGSDRQRIEPYAIEISESFTYDSDEYEFTLEGELYEE